MRRIAMPALAATLLTACPTDKEPGHDSGRDTADTGVDDGGDGSGVGSGGSGSGTGGVDTGGGTGGTGDPVEAALTISMSPEDPGGDDLLLTSAADEELDTYRFTAGERALFITDLSFNLEEPGAVQVMRFTYLDGDGNPQEVSEIVSGSSLQLEGLQIYIPAHEHVDFQVFLDTNDLGPGQAVSGAIFGAHFDGENLGAFFDDSPDENIQSEQIVDESAPSHMHVSAVKPIFEAQTHDDELELDSESEVCEWLVESLTDTNDMFTIEASEAFHVQFQSDSGFDTSVSTQALLLMEGAEVASGTVVITDESTASVAFTPSAEIEVAGVAELIVQLDSETLMPGYAGELRTLFDPGTALNGTVTPGDVNWTDGYSNFEWLGNTDPSAFACTAHFR